VIHDVMILAKAGRAWANLPSKLRVGRDGQLQRGANEKLLYSPIIEWGTKDLRERFSAAVIGQIQRTHPDLLDGV